MTNDMFEAMNLVAESSCDLMRAGIAHGIGPGEEALTDVNLIHLARLIPSMLVKKFAKKDEAGNGADWEWWIGSSEEELWLKLRIQAKRSSHEGVRYDQVGHKPKDHTLRQYDTLIAQSLNDGAIPFHVFFNGWPGDRYSFNSVRHDYVAMRDRASRDGYVPSLAEWQALHWGCTMVSTQVVKRIHENPSTSEFALVAPFDKVRKNGARTKDRLYVPRYLTHATPWAHLFWSDTPGQMPTFDDVRRNVYRMQGNVGDPPEDAFKVMTYQDPSPEAEEAVYGPGRTSFRKFLTVADKRRIEENNLRARAYLQSFDSPTDLSGILNGTDDTEIGPRYIVVTDLVPEANLFLNPNQDRGS